MVNQAILTQGTPGVALRNDGRSRSELYLGGGFIYCLFSPRKFGKIPNLTNDSYFSKGWKPPTGYCMNTFFWYRFSELPPRRACHWSLKQHRVRYTFGGAGAWNCGNWSQWDGSCNCVTRQWLAFSEHGEAEHICDDTYPTTSWVGWNMLCFEECAGHFWWAWSAGLREQKWCHGPLHHSGRVHDVAGGWPLHSSAMANLLSRSSIDQPRQQKIGIKMKVDTFCVSIYL